MSASVVATRALLAAIAIAASACASRAPRIAAGGAADSPSPRTDQNSLAAHAELVEKAKSGRIDVYFVGDSITRRWGALDYPELLANWTSNFFGWNAANFGWGGDRVQNIDPATATPSPVEQSAASSLHGLCLEDGPPSVGP